MQSTRYPFGEKVVPHTSGAVGSVAGEEAGANLGAELFITPAALTARSCQPGIVPTPRDTERLAQPSRQPDLMADENFSDNLLRAVAAELHLLNRMTVAREMFSKS